MIHPGVETIILNDGVQAKIRDYRILQYGVMSGAVLKPNGPLTKILAIAPSHGKEDKKTSAFEGCAGTCKKN